MRVCMAEIDLHQCERQRINSLTDQNSENYVITGVLSLQRISSRDLLTMSNLFSPKNVYRDCKMVLLKYLLDIFLCGIRVNANYTKYMIRAYNECHGKKSICLESSFLVFFIMLLLFWLLFLLLYSYFNCCESSATSLICSIL